MFCDRHIHNNLKREGHENKALKDLVWATARASYVYEFATYMDYIYKIINNRVCEEG